MSLIHTILTAGVGALLTALTGYIVLAGSPKRAPVPARARRSVD